MQHYEAMETKAVSRADPSLEIRGRRTSAQPNSSSNKPTTENQAQLIINEFSAQTKLLRAT